MKSKYVIIRSINDMTAFVSLCSAVDGDVICRKGKYAVDGKSVLGVMSIDISTGVTVEYPQDANELDSFLEQFKN